MDNLEKKVYNRELIYLAALLAVVVVLYAPVVGKGFIKDDFIWIDSVLKDGKMDFSAPFEQTTGFFRPLVGISFGLQHELSGRNPLPYGLFNLGLHLLNIFLIYLLLKMFRKTKDYALLAAGLFALNAKAVRMAVGWISGRTALLYTFFLLLMFIFHFLVFRKYIEKSKETIKTWRNSVYLILSAFSFLCALLSKESAVAAPLFLFFILLVFIEKESLHTRLRKALMSVVIYIPIILLYLFLRGLSDAFTPFNAPEYYRFSMNPVIWISNFFEYIIRGGLLDVVVLISLTALGLIVGRFVIRFSSTGSKKIFYSGLIWYATFILLYLPIPFRSDLYSYFTQIGLHISVVILIYDFVLKPSFQIKKVKKLIITAACIVLAVWMVYLVGKASTLKDRGLESTRFVQQTISTFTELPDGSSILVFDRDGNNINRPLKTISYGFDSLLNMFLPAKGLKGFITGDEKDYSNHFDEYRFHYYWDKGKYSKVN